jgi:hypothetical protein
MALDDDAKKWLSQLLDRKIEGLRAQLVVAQRSQERRKLLANGNIPTSLANLDLLIEDSRSGFANWKVEPPST